MLTALCALALSAGSAGAPAVAEVEFKSAPGEVGSPVESVTVSRRGDTRTIRLWHKGPGAKDEPRVETRPLSAAEFDAVWAIVTREKLLEFTPEPQPGTFFDYGTSELRTTVADAPGDPPRVRVKSWDAPLKNEDRVSPLVLLLAKLAREHGREVKLELFVP